MLFGCGNPVVLGRRPQERSHEALRRRPADGELTPAQYEEHKALLERGAYAAYPTLYSVIAANGCYRIRPGIYSSIKHRKKSHHAIHDF